MFSRICNIIVVLEEIECCCITLDGFSMAKANNNGEVLDLTEEVLNHFLGIVRL